MITRQELRTIRTKAAQALQEALGDDYFVQEGSGKYGESATITLKVFRRGQDGEVVTDLQRDFVHNASLLGLDPGDFGAQFMSNGHMYEIVGLKVRNRKYPIIAKRVGSDQRYKFHESTVKAAKNIGGSYWVPAND